MGPEPQRTKFQALGTTEEALADKPGWLPTPSVVIGPANGESFRASSMKILRAGTWGWIPVFDATTGQG